MCPKTITLPEPGGCSDKVLGHLSKDKISKRVKRGREKSNTLSKKSLAGKGRVTQNYAEPAAAAVTAGSCRSCGGSTKWHGSLHLLAPENYVLVGDNASLRREFKATFDVLGCWGWLRALKTCQYSPLIFHQTE